MISVLAAGRTGDRSVRLKGQPESPHTLVMIRWIKSTVL
jgi:hypothetical protein